MPQSPKVELKVQQRSGFDKSHYRDGTFEVGQLVPVLIDELIPNSTVSLGVGAVAQLPPLASDSFAHVDLKLEAFFVPHRVIYRGFESWFTQQPINTIGDMEVLRETVQCLPNVSFNGFDDIPESISDSSLLDWLGYHPTRVSALRFSLMPLAAYWKCYDDWYRSPLVQNSVFGEVYANIGSLSSYCSIARMPSEYLDSNPSFGIQPSDDDYYPLLLADGRLATVMARRNYGFDYFTNAWPSLQSGNPMSVSISGNSFTVAALRAANSMQQFEERNQFSPRLNEAVKSRYGASLSDSIAQRSVFLGSDSFPLKTYGIDVTASNADVAGSFSSKNPFAQCAGAELGRAVANGASRLVDGFTANEPGYLIVMASVVPRALYGTGTDRLMMRYAGNFTSIGEMANPLLQNVGNEPIYREELNGNADGTVFGFTDRYASWMIKRDSVHGLLRDGQSLSSFALKRSFTSPIVSINSSFLEIPATALDEISATNYEVSLYGCWAQFAFDYKVVQPLARYSIPSLQDPAYEHGDTITMHRGGFRF